MKLSKDHREDPGPEGAWEEQNSENTSGLASSVRACERREKVLKGGKRKIANDALKRI